MSQSVLNVQFLWPCLVAIYMSRKHLQLSFWPGIIFGDTHLLPVRVIF